MTAPLGQLPEADLCLPGRGRIVQLFRDRPVCGQRFGTITRREPGPPPVSEKLRTEERLQRRGGVILLCSRGVRGPERVLVRTAAQAVGLRSELLAGSNDAP